MGPTRDDMVLRGITLDRLSDRRSLLRRSTNFAATADSRE